MAYHRCGSALCTNWVRKEDDHYQHGLLFFCCYLCYLEWQKANNTLNAAADKWASHRRAQKKWWQR